MIILFVQISQSPMSTTVIALVTVLACVLVSHTVMVIIVIVMCFVLKKNKRDVQEHIYDSVVSAVPAPTTHALISTASTTITDDDKVKKLPRDLQKYKLTCNVAYGSYKLAETTPNTD